MIIGPQPIYSRRLILSCFQPLEVIGCLQQSLTKTQLLAYCFGITLNKTLKVLLSVFVGLENYHITLW